MYLVVGNLYCRASLQKEASDKVAALESVHEAAGGGYIPAHR
jgi:hypothetical protein